MNETLGKRIINGLRAPAIAIVASMIVSSIALLISGHSPIRAFTTMIDYVASTESIVKILNRAAPLYVLALGVAIGFKMNLFNIGADGQYRLAALVAAAAGPEINLPRPLHIITIMIIAMVVGGAWAAVPGVLKVTRGVNEVVSTIMLNFIATGLSAYLLTQYFKNDKVTTAANITETKSIPKSGSLPSLDGFIENFGFHFPPRTSLAGFLPVAIVVGIIFYLVVWRTRFGYELRMTGANSAAARSSGVSPGAMIIKTIVASGALAGLAAMGFLLTDFPKYNEAFPLGLAFTAISVALLGSNHPGGIAVAAFAWTAVERGSQGLANEKIPGEITKILLGTLLISSVISFEVVRRRNLATAVRQAAHQITATPSPAGATS